MKKRHGKFRVKVFILVFLVSFLSLTVYSLVVSTKVNQVTHEKVYEDTGQNAIAIRNQVDQSMEIVEDMLKFLAESEELQHRDFNGFNRMVLGILEVVPTITQIYVMEADGMQVYKSSHTETMGDRSDRAYFEKAIKGEMVFSDVILSRSTDVPIVVHAQPVYREGKIDGVIGASIDLSFLSSLTLLSFSDPYSSYGYIVDSKGLTIGHPDPVLVSQMHDLSYLEPVAEAIAGKSGTGYYSFRDIDKLVSYMQSQKTDWSIFYQIPVNEAFKMSDRINSMFLLSIGAVTLFALAASYVISSFLHKPINRLVSIIGKIAKDRGYAPRISPDGDEFGIIEEELAELTDEIKKARDNLEDKVMDRTRELTYTMDKLVKVQGELVEANEKLKTLSLTDMLTNLPNRRSFDDYLKNFWKLAMRNGVPGALLMIDIDYFKFFNDTYGHVEGDECLQVIAGKLSKIIYRDSDFLARYGGEEFVVVLNGTTPRDTAKKAEMLCRGIEGLHYPHRGNPDGKWVTVSVGALFIKDLNLISKEDAVLRVDELLYTAKDQGRNRFVTDRI